ncbi:hypothetical protein BLSTO_00999 [Blastocystis sp. subtype 1]
MQSFTEELTCAIAVLDDYGQYEDALWLMEVLRSADSRNVAKIHRPIPINPPMSEEERIAVMNIKTLYTREQYESIHAYERTKEVPSLSLPELFFYADSVYRLWNAQYSENPKSFLITTVETELCRRFEANQSNAFCSYVLGCIWKRKDDKRASSAFLASISQFPYFWSCWRALSDVVVTSADFNALSDSIDSSFILKYFFLLLTTNRLTQSSTPLSLHNTLASVFPSNAFLRLQLATYYYNHHLLASLEQTLHAFATPPTFTRADADAFATLSCNLLYLQRDAAGLGALCQTLAREDPLLPSLPLVQGSYWSVLGQHEKAVLCMTEATEKTPSGTAWLLLGHEYVDLKNPKVAAACYQRAVRANPRDYRGYFALGRVYEAEGNGALAYYYLMRAVALQEKLPLLWLALGDFLRSEGKEEQALEAYAHGRRSDGRLESREGRVCLMRVCWASVTRGVLGEEDVRNAVLWLREACACQDGELASEEGVKILRAVMGVYEERGGGEGLELCEELEKCSDVGVREEVAVWKRWFEEEMSVSMDCSE